MRKKEFNITTEVKAIARERIGTIPCSKTIKSKANRNKPKHKKRFDDEEF